MRSGPLPWLMLSAGALLLLHSAYLVAANVTHLGTLLPATAGVALVGLAMAGDRWQQFLHAVPWRVLAWRAGLMVGALWLVSLAVFFVALQKAGRQTQLRVPPQAIVVLGSSTPRGVPSPTLARRLDLALALAQRHPAAVVVTSGGVDFRETVAEGAVMAAYLRERGLAPDRILVEDRSTSTQENLAFSRQLLQAAGRDGDNGEVPMLLVTSDFHTLRAAAIARKTGWSQVATAGAETPLYMRYNAWLREYFACLSSWVLREF
ncbi:YdcF family protein [uncultured Xylophilus sp.]|uniref:YdcF family protein n=1 Tax=uncultured Xylophilus sp. TaxID=296832 RepID=UPI0025E04010|nr:YdcF family protein [uncultured Xylophilus sp.]